MVIFTLPSVYYELTPAKLVVPGSVLSLYHVFTPLILTAARWGGAYGYPCSQMGKLGFRELRCFAYLPITVSPPWLGVGTWPKSGFWEPRRSSSVEPCKELCPSAPLVSGGWPCRPTPHGGRQSAAGEPRRHTQSSREKNHRGASHPSDASQLCEPFNPLVPNAIWVGFLSPKKSRLIKHFIELKREYLTSSWLARQAILFPRK